MAKTKQSKPSPSSRGGRASARDKILRDYLKRILTAPVYDVARESPLSAAPRLGSRLGCQVLLKREDMQPVFSFKGRGAYTKMVHLSADERAAGVIAASAGNHAQGVAYAARQLGIKALIVMPKTTPGIKVSAVQGFGAKIKLYGDTYDEAAAHAHELAESQGLTFVHPYDDPHVIAGQGTVGMEVLRQQPGRLDAIFVPVGGGGLVAGVAAYVKAVRPEVQVIGVEPDNAACMQAALEKGRRVVLPEVGIFADGVAVRQAGKETFRVAKVAVDRVITVGTDEICAAIKDIFDDTRSVAEPAGALALAGLKAYVQERAAAGTQASLGQASSARASTEAEPETYAAVVSGANMNFDRLRHVAERAEIGEHREALLAVTIPERAGSFRAFCKALGDRPITEFNYRYSSPREAHVFAGVQLTGGATERAELVASLQAAGYPVTDLTDNEMAKLHVRYMVGGRPAEPVPGERLYRFRFPERPGALVRFLMGMGKRWNISMFHYRNHGAAYGRVLAGVQVSGDQDGQFRGFLDSLGYAYWEETANPAYALFLRACGTASAGSSSQAKPS